MTTNTKSTTSTHLSVAFAMLLASGGLAYMAGSGALPSSQAGGEYGYGYNACGLSQFSVSESCEKKYSGTAVICYDGKKFTANSCVTQAEALKLCIGHCKGNKCGANTVKTGRACEQQFKQASGTCADGSPTGNLGGGCKTASSYRTRMENTCANLYCGPTANGQLAFSLASNSPLDHLQAVGLSGSVGEISMLELDATATVEDIDIKKLEFYYFPVSGSDEQSSFQTFTLFANAQTLGTVNLLPAQVVGQPAKIIFTMPAGALRILKDTSTRLSVQARINSTSQGTQSAMSPRIQLGDGTTPDTAIVEAVGASSGTSLPASAVNGTDTLRIGGTHLVLYRSFPTIDFVNSGFNVLINGVEQDIYSFRIQSAPIGPIAVKQLKFSMDVMDNVGSANPNIFIHSFKLYRGATNLTDRVNIQLPDGGTLLNSSSTIGIGAGKIFYITWKDSNEEYFDGNESKTFTIKSTLQGFTNDADDDYVRVRMLNDEQTRGELSQVFDPYFLVAGASQYRTLMVLGDGMQEHLNPANVIWSDRSSSHHTAWPNQLGNSGTVTSTGDWFNGYLMNTPADYHTLTR